MKQKITLSLDVALLQQATVFATEKNQSVNAYLEDILSERVANAHKYESHRRQAIALMEHGFNLGGKYLTREQAHERR